MVRRAAVAFALVAFIVPAAAQQRDRASIPEKYKWDLTHIYPSNAAWRAAKDKLEADIPSIRQFKGTLGNSPAALADALERVTALRKTLYRVATYANLQADQDTRHAEHQGMRQEMTLLGASFGTEVAFIEPEILQIGRDKLQQFVSSEPRLASYRFYLDEIVRQAAHTLSEPEERILASAASVTAAPSTTSGSAAECGVSVSKCHAQRRPDREARSADLRGSPAVEEPRRSRESDVGVLRRARRFSQTLGSTLSGSVRASQFYANAAEVRHRISQRGSMTPTFRCRCIRGSSKA